MKSMKSKDSISLYARALVRTLYPEPCPLCNTQLRAWEASICPPCLATFQELRPPLCSLCARELPLFSQLSLCQECRRHPHYADHTCSLFAYNNSLKELLHKIKFGHRRSLLYIFRDAVQDFAGKLPFPIDCVIPVPLDPRKKRERGFNQALLLASFFEGPLACHVQETLTKRKPTPPQSLLSKQERLTNLRESFQVSDPLRIRGRHILLVDDVYTTGATVNECARVLKENGATSVSVFTLARAGGAGRSDRAAIGRLTESARAGSDWN